MVNHKKIQRLWREEGLRVPQRRRRKRHGTSTAPPPVSADAPNRVWAVDFQFDSTTDGRPIKIVSIVDEHTRECLGGMVERGVTGEHLIGELGSLAAERGTFPAVLRCDNGPELACSAMADWASGQVGLHFIPPGEPWRNGYVESFNSRIPRRMPQHQQLLVAGAGPRGHQRLETRLQPPPPALCPGLTGLPLKSWRLFYAASGWSAASLSYWIGDINAAELCLRRVL
jgi:transposase InsO family protein